MSDPTITGRLPTAIPRWGFVKGFLTGAVIEIPAIATAVWLLARVGIGDPDAGFMHIARLTAVFAGVAALFTAGGIGRLAAHASVERGGRWRAVAVAARAHAAAGAGLALIAAIPHGHLPTHSWQWLSVLAFGAVFGAACGAVIGMVSGGLAPVGIGDVLGLARRPTDAIRQLLDPEDLLKLGAAMRTRTSKMFEGMFEPAERPPEATAKPEPAPPASAPSEPAGDAPPK
jgi:hypothetical protein